MSTTVTQTNGHAGTSTDGSSVTSATKIQPNDVGWQFVPQYYNFVSKQPHRLHCFYNKRSTFVHGEEGDDTTVALGQQEIHERISKIGYDGCKVYINSIDSQSSAGGGIVIQVLGEMTNANKPWRKFAQTFFLAEQPNGYFVLNDIFRYLKEDTDDEEEEVDSQDAPAVTAPAQIEVASVPISVPAPVPIANEAPIPESEPEAAEAEPEIDAPVVEEVPVEALVASIPDKDVAPEEPAAIETSAEFIPEVVEEAKTIEAASPVPIPAEPKVEAPATNDSSAASLIAPTKPAAPKSWATLAAGGKTWGSLLAGQQTATAPVAAPVLKKVEPLATPSPVPAPAPAVVAPSQVNGNAQAPPTRPFFDGPVSVKTPHCFVKLPNWSANDQQSSSETMDEPTLRAIASRFGDVVKVEIVKGKACAFIEFAKIESARKAIIASLPTHQGGEGGVMAGDGRLNFETRKEKDERGPKGRRGGAPEPRGGSGTQRGARIGGTGPRDSEGPIADRGTNANRGRGRPSRGAPGGSSSDRPAPVATAVTK